MNNVGFIGTGNMGFAIMQGISKSSLKDNVNLFAFDLKSESLERCSSIATLCSSEKDVLQKCKYVFLAVKPQVIEGVLATIKDYVTKDTVIVSILAGITGEYIKSQTIPDAKVVLVMPNTPLLLNEGASALSPVSPVSNDEFNFVRSIFNSCGKTAVLTADKMKEVIAINGSSPAFIYLYAKAFIDYAVENGISEKSATDLFAQSLIGSAKMITDSGYTLDELIKMVSSPGGTTLAGLDELYKGNLTDITKKCCESCTKRAYELSK
ncbi:MAG: pyrroline-5-carboxylate reductase [Ruminococcus sp.]|nr:pyrroline-5-carboxylate reductase [Ruminococcus sp.]